MINFIIIIYTVNSLDQLYAHSSEEDKHYLINVITPPLESDYGGLLGESEIAANYQLIGDLPDSPDSLTSSSGTTHDKYPSHLHHSIQTSSSDFKLSNIATHSQLHSNHRFHPFHTSNGNCVGGSNHHQQYNSTGGSGTPSNNSTPTTTTSAPSSLSNREQMPETDCYFPSAATNMLDYHLNSAYIGELSPTKCNADYQVNGYASNYYSR